MGINLILCVVIIISKINMRVMLSLLGLLARLCGYNLS